MFQLTYELTALHFHLLKATAGNETALRTSRQLHVIGAFAKKSRDFFDSK